MRVKDLYDYLAQEIKMGFGEDRIRFFDGNGYSEIIEVVGRFHDPSGKYYCAFNIGMFDSKHDATEDYIKSECRRLDIDTPGEIEADFKLRKKCLDEVIAKVSTY